MARGKNPSVWIYALVDPRDQTARYVGRSRDPMARLSWHAAPGRLKYQFINRRLYGWIEELATAGLRPMLLIIERREMLEAPAGEQKWIDHYRARGEIFNSTGRRTGLVPIKRSKTDVLGYK